MFPLATISSIKAALKIKRSFAWTETRGPVWTQHAISVVRYLFSWRRIVGSQHGQKKVFAIEQRQPVEVFKETLPQVKVRVIAEVPSTVVLPIFRGPHVFGTFD